MCKHQKLSGIIANAYDAALDPTLWPDVLAQIADFTDGQVGGLVAADSREKRVNARHHAGGDAHYMRLYTQTYAQLGPIATSLFRGVGQVVSIPEVVRYDEFCRGRFYQEWARPQGWVDVAIAPLEKSGTRCAYLTVARDQTGGMVDDEMRRRMALVAPHVQRAVHIGAAIEFKQAEVAAFVDVLDSLSTGIFVVDADGRLVHNNAAANEILDSGEPLRAISGRLFANDVLVDQALREALAAASKGDAELGNRGAALSLPGCGDERFVAHVLPLTSGERRFANASYAATAALFVRKVAMQYPSAPEVIGKAYGLTPAELRVLFGIVQIGGVPEVAAAFGVAEVTIKTHLGRLFGKTRTGRQADLVKLVAGFSLPLAS